MIEDHDIGPLLDRWFADGPSQVSDRVMDEVAGRIHRQRRRPLVRLRFPVNSPLGAVARPLAQIAAVLLVIVAGDALILGGQSTAGGLPRVSAAPVVPTPYAPIRVPIPVGAHVILARQEWFSTNLIVIKRGESIYLDNLDDQEHDVSIEGTGIRIYTGAGASASGVIDLPPGTYTFFSSSVDYVMPGGGADRDWGMEGTLIVRP